MSVLTRIRPRPSEIDPLRDLTRWFVESGANNGPLLDYWYKPGIPTTFSAYMRTTAGGSGFISSTTDSDKGFIYLGSAQTSAFDEDLQRLGLNVAAPLAKLHMKVGSPVGQSGVPISDQNIASIVWADQAAGTTNIYQSIDEASASDTDYIVHTRRIGGYTAYFGTLVDPVVHTGHVLRVRVRIVGTLNGNDHMALTLNQTGVGSPIFVSNDFPGEIGTGPSSRWSPSSTSFTTSFVTYEATLTEAEAANITDYTQLSVSFGYFTSFDDEAIEVSWVNFGLPGVGGGSAETLQKWETPSYSDLLDFTSDGSSGATLDLTLSGDAPLRISAGGGTSGLRFLTSSTNGRIEAGDSAQANMNLVLSGARDAIGTELTSKFANTRVTGTIEINGGGPVAGDVLTALDTDGLATWGASTATAGTWAYVLVTANYSALTTDTVIDCIGSFTVTLPTAVGVTGKLYDVKNSGGGIITIATTSGQTIDDGLTAVMRSQYESLSLISNGSDWEIW